MTEEGTVDKGKLIDRIKKLLAMAESANEHEAAAFAAKAQNLLQRHQLELAEVLATTGRDTKGEIKVVRVPFLNAARAVALGKSPYASTRSSWEIHLANFVSEAFFCKALFNKVEIHFIGRELDLEVATYTYAVLARRIEDLAQIRTREFGVEFQQKYGYSYRYATGAYHPKSWRMSWIEGAVLGVGATLKEQSERFRNANQGSTGFGLLSLRGAEVDEFAKARTHGQFVTTSNNKNGAARSAGFIEGKSLEIRRGITAEDQETLILRDTQSSR